MKKKRSLASVIPDLLIVLFNCLVIVVTLYPFIYVLSMSVSDPVAAMKQEIFLLPKGINFGAYKMVLEDPTIWNSYYNTLWYTIVGTTISVLLTVTVAYPLSRKRFFARNAIMMFITFTMFFSGGLIPQYVLVNALHMYNTRWAIVLPTAISAYNVIVARTFFEGLPESMYEAARIDGASEVKTLFKIIVPLSMPIISVLILFYAVGLWNSYFPALIYLADETKQPLQLFMYKLLVKGQESMTDGMADSFERSLIGSQLKYAAIIVSILPIICVYPFLQKYFVQGVMVGAVKE